MKATSFRPIKRARQQRTPTGTDPGKAGPTPSISEGGPSYNKNLDKTQSGDRSLGLKRITTRPQERGL